MDLGLKDAHVLVTGASGGIGLETARLFLTQGARVTAHFNTKVEPLGPLIDEFGLERVRPLQANLSREDDVARLFAADELLASNAEGIVAFGPVQVLVVNHGWYDGRDVPIGKMTLEQWENTVSQNLTSSFLACREYLQQLEDATNDQKEKASIVIIGSTAGKYGEASHADYAASKSALMYGLTLSLKNEIVRIAPRGRVNCVAPGWTRTPMAAEALRRPEVIYQALATTPLRKVAEPRDVAGQILVLASPVLSGHITGQVVMVEGGMEGRLLNKPEDISGPS